MPQSQSQSQSQSQYSLHILNVGMNGVTGHHEIEARIEEIAQEGHTIQGVPEVYGIEPTVLQTRFGGDLLKWRSENAGKKLKRHLAHSALQGEILKWKGEKVAVALPPPPPPAPPNRIMPPSLDLMAAENQRRSKGWHA